jgi:hypothetical protein
MIINKDTIQTELQELAGKQKITVKLDKHNNYGCSLRETDRGISIRLNPSKIRCSKTLDRHLGMCREAVGI